MKTDAPEGFDAPWQAEAYSIGQALIEAGHISPDEWANALGEALRRLCVSEGRPDNAETYSEAVFEALSHVTRANALLAEGEVEQRAEDWRAAYLRTPHGQPVKLA